MGISLSMDAAADTGSFLEQVRGAGGMKTAGLGRVVMRQQISWAVAVLCVVIGTIVVAQKDKEPAQQEWTGTVHTGIVAVGGETTGIVLETAKGKFELKAATDAVLADLKKADGQRATVRGTLARQPGVEKTERVIITVTKVTVKPRVTSGS